MDAGLAAVLGALAGSVATIGAALATGWAQREGARITARSEHRRQRLESRSAVYKQFLLRANDLRAAILPHAENPGVRISFHVDIERVELAANKVREVWSDVALAGPQSVAKCANSIRVASYLILISVGQIKEGSSEGDGSTPGYQAELILIDQCEHLGKLLDEFESVARKALDDDGSTN
ncbi:hypothetical protein [Streptomyces sp. AC558_RSS880]|uniref:hypothetical protein n=1 Tax=Streptomyces sp. AC558_RSS880 TaxID=2823687 RepID=UPI001C222548|nr:hypothetical protein [Streptomyces sp. AC558_RSS880]